MPRHPFLLAGFGLKALLSARALAQLTFYDQKARGMFAGLAAHSFLRLDAPISASFGLVLGTVGHAVGWPIPRGGSQQISNAMAAYLRDLGGEIVTGSPVEAIGELPSARAVLFDLSPKQILNIVGDKFPASYRRQLERFRYNPGVFKMDFALDGRSPGKQRNVYALELSM